MIISVGMIVVFLNVISNIVKNLENPNLVQSLGTLYADTNYLGDTQRIKLAQFHIIVFLLRRLLYALIIIFLYKHPLFQQILNIAIHSLTFGYDLFMKPYSMKTMLGLLIYFFDFIAFAIFASLPVYLTPTSYSEQLGRIHIYIIVATCGISWIVIIFMSILNLYIQYKAYNTEERKRQVHTHTHIYIYIYIYRQEWRNS